MKYASKICGNRPRLHILVNLTWYGTFLRVWDSTAVIYSHGANYSFMFTRKKIRNVHLTTNLDYPQI